MTSGSSRSTFGSGDWGPDEMRLIEPAEFWRRCAMTSVLPETSAPSPGAFAESFKQAADDGCIGVVCLTLASRLSATYQAACAGADEVRERVKVRVVDTRSVTLGQAMVVLEAAKVAATTNDLDTTEAAALAVVPRIRVFGALDTMDYARKGGRIGTIRALMGSLLSIKPIVEIRDGYRHGRVTAANTRRFARVPRQVAEEGRQAGRTRDSARRRARSRCVPRHARRHISPWTTSSSTTSAPSSGPTPGPGAWASAIGLRKPRTANVLVMSSEPPPKDDWAAQLTEKVGQLVELVRDHTVRPVQKFVRAAIFGALAFSVVIFVIVAFVIGVIRLLNNEVFAQRVWASYLLVGGIFVVTGTLISRMRHSRS